MFVRVHEVGRKSRNGFYVFVVASGDGMRRLRRLRRVDVLFLVEAPAKST